jgi:hypothetical protein
MPYTRTELENYQWYQDKIEARRDEYNSYLKEVETEQVDDETINHNVDENGVLLSFENIDDEVRLQEPFRRAGLDRPDQYIVRPNQYPKYNKGQKFDATIDTNIKQLILKASKLPSVRLANAPNENALEPKLFNDPDYDGTILSPTALTPSRKVPRERTDGYTIDLVNGDIVATKDWFETEVDTEEEQIDNYLQVWYLEDNIRRQFPDLHIFNSYIGTLLSSFIELEILLIEKEDLDLIPIGTPMKYNTR